MMKQTLFTAIAWVLFAANATAAQLFMFESDNCHYCQQWHAEIGHIYPKTAESEFAPLVLHDISEPRPEGVEFKTRIVFTPTFVLVADGLELDRIEGYPGEDFFWGLLGMILKEHLNYEN